MLVENSTTSRDLLVRQVTEDVIGREQIVSTPFGEHVLCYADFTASGRALRSVETFLQREVLPFYGNTHTTTSTTGRRTTQFRDQARKIIADAVHATHEDSVIFSGSGTTSAIHKLVVALGLHAPLTAHIEPSQRPVVFVGPFEHHSNLLPWRESGADIVVIPENGQGHVDVDELAVKLKQFANRPLKIGAFSAASNLTGVLTDVNRVTSTLHRHGALAFWDYATCAPYTAIDMNPEAEPSAYKDAIYFSGHKFVGGPGSPGVLVVKTRLLANAVPTMPGGGTVFFVSERDHRYLSNREEREEGGTPDILGSIRLGLAFQIKQRIGAQHIMALERKHVVRVRNSFARNDKLVLLGRDDMDQLPVFSFLVRCGDRFLHYNFVSALLNDLFGIQTRSGCQCAGPYATRLLGITKADLVVLEGYLVHGIEVIRPGSSRMSIPYFMDDDEIEFILQAIHFVANHASKFLPLYSFAMSTGQWTYSGRKNQAPSVECTLYDFSISNDPQTTGKRNACDPTRTRRQALEEAYRLASTLAETSPDITPQRLPAECESLRWFAYAGESVVAAQNAPLGAFRPQRYVAGDLLRQWDEPHALAREPSDAFPLRGCLTESFSTEPLGEVPADHKKLTRWRRLRAALKVKLLRLGGQLGTDTPPLIATSTSAA